MIEPCILHDNFGSVGVGAKIHRIVIGLGDEIRGVFADPSDFGKELSVHIHPLGICGGLPRYSVHLPRLKRHNDPECPVFCVGIPLCYSTVFEVLRSIQPSRIVFSGRKSERNAFP